MKLSSKRLWAIIIVAIVICAMIVIGLSKTGIFTDNKEDIQVKIILSTNSTLVGENITFEFDASSGPIRSWYWDFGDGSSSEERAPSHSFNRSDYFNVTLLVNGSEGRNASSTVVVEVQNHDLHEVLTGDLIAFPTRRVMPYDLIYFDIYSGITSPHVTGRWSGTSASREIAIFIMTNPTGDGPRLVSEAVDVGIGDFDLTRESDMPEDATYDHQYIMVLQSNGGAITDYRLELTVDY